MDEDSVINRRQRTNKPKTLDTLFDSDQESSYSDIESSHTREDYTVSDAAMAEIFGTGKEYAYIYEQKSVQSTHKKMETVYKDGIVEFVAFNTSLEPRVINLLLEGFSPNFLVLHRYSLKLDSVHELFKAVDLIEFYNGLGRVDSPKYLESNFYGQLISLDKVDENGMYKTNNIIALEQIRENLNAGEIINDVVDLNSDSFVELLSNDKMFQFYAVKEAVDYINGSKIRFESIKQVLEEGNNTIIDTYDLKIEEIFSRMLTLFPNLKKSFKKAVRRINIVSFIKQHIKQKKEENRKKNLFIDVIDRVVNGRILIEDSYMFYMGMALVGNKVEVVVVNYLGEVAEKESFKLGEEPKLGTKYAIKSAYVSSNNPRIRLLFKSWKSAIEIKFVDNKYISNVDDPLCIVRHALFPEMAIIENGGRDEHRAVLSALSIVGVDLSLVKKYFGLFVFLYNNSVSHIDTTLYKDIYSAGRNYYTDCRFYQEIEEAYKMVCGCFRLSSIKLKNEVLNDNLQTYLRIKGKLNVNIKDHYVLDEKAVHPHNYKYILICCAVVFNTDTCEDTENDKILTGITSWEGSVKEKKEMREDEKEDENTKEISNIAQYNVSMAVKYFNIKNRDFEGCPDDLVFYNCFRKQKVKAVEEGEVVYVGTKFAMINIDDKYCVRVINQNLALNSRVKVLVGRPNTIGLVYEGKVIKQNKFEREIKSSPNYRILDSAQALKYLNKTNDTYIIRGDKEFFLMYKINHDIIINKSIYKEMEIKVTLREKDNNDDLYFDDSDNYAGNMFRNLYEEDYYLNEEDDEYSCYSKRYTSLDKLIADVYKSLALIKGIKAHKFYCKNEEAAIENLKNSKYSFYLSRKYPGYLVFCFEFEGVKQEYIKIHERLKFDVKSFDSIDEFLVFRTQLKK